MATLRELVDEALIEQDAYSESEAEAVARYLADKVVLKTDLEPVGWVAQAGYRFYAEKVSDG